MVFISPKNIIVDFLRHRLTDPRARAEDSRTEEFNGGGATFSLTASVGKMSCITAVTVDGTTQIKWADYYIDFQNQKVIFYSNTAGGTNNVDITYKQGTSNWIHADKVRESLSRTAFPRMNVLVVGGTGERLGQYNSNIQSVIHFQVDVWAKENQKQTISSVVYANDKLSEYFAYEVTKAFRAYVDDLHPALYNYTLLGTPRDLGYNQEMQCFHTVVEFELKGIDVSEGES